MSVQISTESLIELRALVEHIKFTSDAILPTPHQSDIVDALDRITKELERIEQRELSK